MTFNSGDVVALEHKDNGANSSKPIRYAVIISGDIINKNLETVIVCPLIESETVSESRIGATFIPREVTGLEVNRVVFSPQIKTVSKNQIQRTVSALPPVYIHQIKESLKVVLDIQS